MKTAYPYVTTCSRLAIVVGLMLALGCGGRTIGGAPTDAGPDPTDGPLTDGPLSDVHIQPIDSFGYVLLGHSQERGDDYDHESMVLMAAFYEEAYDPLEQRRGLIAIGTTVCGVICDIYYVSGMDGPPPDPEPPTEVDGGRITAGAGFDQDDFLATFFDGYRYVEDFRSPADSEDPWPGWIVPQTYAIQVEGHGGLHAGAFFTEMIVAAPPEIIVPPFPGEPWPADPNGDFAVAWTEVEADSIEVWFTFNLDWDDNAFVCYPPPGVNELILPAQWIEQWTWGSGEMSTIAYNRITTYAGNSAVSIRTARVVRQWVIFDVW